jgi:hypothetical protein
MVDDLIASRLRIGIPMTRVRSLLGRPDEVAAGTWLYNVSAEADRFLDTCVVLELRTRVNRLERAAVTPDS